MPTISVIVPIYKVEKYLHRCVDSILAQTFTNFELILVDDGSPDDCDAICDEYAGKDSRIVVIHQKNGGLSAARNAGIDWAFANSNSEWLTFVDSDDWVHSKYLEVLYNIVQQTRFDISVCGFERTNGDMPAVDEKVLLAEVWDTKKYYVEKNVNATVAWGKLYRKECFQNIRYPVGKLHEDEFTTYKILFTCDKLAVIEQPLYAYFNNPESIMGVGWNPKRLVKIYAFYERILFFKQSNEKDMYQWALKRYLEYLLTSTEKVKEYVHNGKEKKVYLHLLKNRLKKVLISFQRDLPIERYAGYYELAFPWSMQCYWYWNALMGKIRKKR